MTLLQTIRAIERAAAQQPNVGMVVRNDVFRLNATPVAKYGAFAWLQGEHISIESSGLISYAFTFFYVDRLTADASNEVAIQSVGIETLENILRQLADVGIYADQAAFRTFNQRFADECAGVYCTVQLEVPKDVLCAAAFDFVANDGDFNLDFNEDYKVFEWRTQDRTIYII